MKTIKRFFGRLFATSSYMDTLSDREIGEKALGKKGYAAYKRREQLHDELIDRMIAERNGTVETIH